MDINNQTDTQYGGIRIPMNPRTHKPTPREHTRTHTSTPFARSSAATRRPKPASMTAITVGRNSTTVVRRPRLAKASAISRPTKPPPITTAVCGAWVLMYPSMPSMSPTCY